MKITKIKSVFPTRGKQNIFNTHTLCLYVQSDINLQAQPELYSKTEN